MSFVENDDGALISFGGAVKALGDGRIGGYLCRFGGPEHADGDGEWFTPETDFATDFPAKSGVYYHHGLSQKLGKRRLTTGTLAADPEGVTIEAQLDLSDPDQAEIYRAAKAGRLGWSSGSASHLVVPSRNRPGGPIKHWPLGVDASLTPIPSDKRNTVLALKSWAEALPAEADCLTTADHAAQVVAANAEYAERLESRLEARVKAGRVLSAANRQELESVVASLEPVMERIRSVIARAVTATGEAESEAPDPTETPAPESSAALSSSPAPEEPQAAPLAVPDLLPPDVYQQLVRETLSSTGWLEGSSL